MIYCVHCGAANPQEARFCYRCGQALVATPAALSESPPPAPSTAQPTIFMPYTPAAAPYYNQAGPKLVMVHPLARGILGFPPDLEAQPREFYSYVDSTERLIFARRAGFWKRFLAVVVDSIVLFIPFLVITYIDGIIENKINVNPDGTAFTKTKFDTSNSAIFFLILGIALAYFLLTGVLWNGQSIGKRVMKLRVMRLDGRKPDWLIGAVRYLAGYLLSTNFLVVGIVVLIADALGLNQTLSGLLGVIFFGWGFWWAGWDALKQGWHDKLARTLVVDTHEYVEGMHFFRETKS